MSEKPQEVNENEEKEDEVRFGPPSRKPRIEIPPIAQKAMDQAETYRSDLSSISETNLNRRSARDQGNGPFMRKETI